MSADLRVGFQFGEEICEERGVGIDPQHIAAFRVDHAQAALPEPVPVFLHKEGLQGIADLVAHVGIGEIEAGKNDSLEFAFVSDVVLKREVFEEHVEKYNVGWIDEGDLCPPL